jgi:hypothetical protein
VVELWRFVLLEVFWLSSIPSPALLWSLLDERRYYIVLNAAVLELVAVVIEGALLVFLGLQGNREAFRKPPLYVA